MNITIGILALQGAYQKHVDSLARLDVKSLLVRQAAELNHCDALILPGGESTTISRLLQKNDLFSAIKKFAKDKPIMGVCAGLIMMAEDVGDKRVTPLALMPFKIRRNIYGSQLNSFIADLKLNFDNKNFTATFIRAPGVENLSPDISVLATHDDQPVMIGAGKHIALCFHPELSNDTRIYQYWLRQF